MAGLIPQAFIDELLNRVDIGEVIESRVPMKRAGRNYKGLCPFHKEKSPSFTVNSEKQFYYCFGCGAGGNAIGFLMDYERMEFPQAVENLASAAGLEVPREEGDRSQVQRDSNKPIYELLEQCATHFQQQLRQHSQAQQAINYLKSRGLTGQIAKQFGVGYAPPGWDNIITALGGDDAKKHRLLQAGMTIENEEKKRQYDRFRDRIMYPIRDIRGRVIAFGGRVMGDEQPKYLNSPETPVFNKSRELYGLYEARLANRNLKRLIIVEGYMDVIALAQQGITYAAATLGTAIGSAHLERIFRQTNEVVFCFDGDKAGRAAAARALEAALPEINDGRQAWFLFLPDGEDPDSMVREIGKEGFEKTIEQAPPLSEFLFSFTGKGIDLQSVDGRARLAKLALPLINKVPKGFFRQLLLQELSVRTGLGEDGVKALTKDLVVEQNNTPQQTPQSAPPGYDETYADRYQDSPELGNTSDFAQPVQRKKLAPTNQRIEATPLRTALALLLFNPELVAQVEDYEYLRANTNPEATVLVELIDLLKEQPDTPTFSLIGTWMGTDKDDFAKRMLALEHLLPAHGIQPQFEGAMATIKTKSQRAELETELRSLQAISIGEMTTKQKDRLRELLSKLQSLS
ncbi:MAG: DNA primase [Pseudomonadales bacterium]|jgi:DNA primase